MLPQAALPGWATTATGCDVWDPNPLPNERVLWTGGCVDGRAEGPGRLSWRSPRVGPGAATFINTSIYEGSMRAGLEEGPAHDRFFNRSTGTLRVVRQGTFHADQLEGPGSDAVIGGFRYDGDFLHGERDGHGVSRYPGGETYVGTFRRNLYDGTGVLTGKAQIRLGPGSGITRGPDTAAPGGFQVRGAFGRGQPHGIATLVMFDVSADRPRTVLAGQWIAGCLAHGPTGQACIVHDRVGAPVLAQLPATHPAEIEFWLARPQILRFAAGEQLAGTVILRCDVTANGVATSCDVKAGGSERLDAAASLLAIDTPWIPAASDGIPVGGAGTAITVKFEFGTPPEIEPLDRDRNGRELAARRPPATAS